ncbi:MAG: hypothetical protein GF311_28275, partial [Candidatus Lokiarchaeota archaeon]|nr:hypothetical protein [Candidatus Lokiarchaeota archaeon]
MIICTNCGNSVSIDLKVCPTCNEKYFDKPGIERELFNLQDVFVKDRRNKEIFEKFYLKLNEYCRPITVKLLKSRKSYISYEEFDDRIHDITVNFMDKYFNAKKFFKVKGSFYGYLSLFIRGELWIVSKHDDHESLNTLIHTDIELGDMLSKVGYSTIGNLEYDVEEEIIDKGYHENEVLESISEALITVKKKAGFRDYFITLAAVSELFSTKDRKIIYRFN